MTEPANAAQITELATTLRRQWKVVLASTAVGCVLAVAVGLALPAHHAAEAVVAVNPVNTDPGHASADSGRAIAMATERELAKSGRVAAVAAKRLQPRFDVDVRDVQDATTVEVPQGSEVLVIRFSASSPRQAVVGASTVAAAYLDTRRDVATARIKHLREHTKDQIDALSGDSGSEFDNQARLAQADTLGASLAALAVADPDPGHIVGPPQLPPSRSNLMLASMGMAGLLLGLFVGAAVALRRTDSRIHTVAGMETDAEDLLVLDGTRVADRTQTWDLVARMVNNRAFVSRERTIVVDGEDPAGRLPSGQELVDALQRRGVTAEFVAAESIDEKLLKHGWPSDGQRRSWAGKVVVIDTTKLDSDADRVTLAAGADSVVIARRTDDDAVALHRRMTLLKMGGAKIAMSVLFPARPALVEAVQ
jgi:capsular polysaccharide biosynthesis protein